MATQRGALPSTGDRDLDALFVGAEKWIEADIDDSGQIAAIRVFVRHPQYTGCSAQVEITPVTTEETGPGVRVSDCETRRTITDDGRTPAAAIARVARVTQRMVVELKRRGGPKGMPLDQQLQIVKDWLESEHTRNQEMYAMYKGISDRHLRRLVSKFRESGEIE